MKYLKLFLLLALFVEIHADPVQTGHAEVSLVKGPMIENKLVTMIGPSSQ